MKRQAWRGLGGVAACVIVACGGTVNLREEVAAVGGTGGGTLAGGKTSPGRLTVAGTASTLGGSTATGGTSTGPGMYIGGATSGGSMYIGGVTSGGSMYIGGRAAEGGAPSGGLGAGGGITPVAGTMAVGGTDMGGGPASGEHSRCLMVSGPFGCCLDPVDGSQPPHATNLFFSEDGEPVSMECASTACGPIDMANTGPYRCGGSDYNSAGHAYECGSYTLLDAQDCLALGYGPTGDLFACGDLGLQCEKGLYYCKDGYSCVQLPDPCQDTAASCACYESVHGPPVQASGGWSCLDLGPGTFSIQTVP